MGGLPQALMVMGGCMNMVTLAPSSWIRFSPIICSSWQTPTTDKDIPIFDSDVEKDRESRLIFMRKFSGQIVAAINIHVLSSNVHLQTFLLKSWKWMQRSYQTHLNMCQQDRKHQWLHSKHDHFSWQMQYCGVKRRFHVKNIIGRSVGPIWLRTFPKSSGKILHGYVSGFFVKELILVVDHWGEKWIWKSTSQNQGEQDHIRQVRERCRMCGLLIRLAVVVVESSQAAVFVVFLSGGVWGKSRLRYDHGTLGR